MGVTDYIGGRGEAIAFMHLSRVCRAGSGRPYFWPHYLGEKCQTFDFLVELVDAGEKTPIFIAQVKSTRQKVNRARPRLRVKVGKKDVRRMAAYPAPTYVIGVHEDEERTFVISVHGAMSEAIPSITTDHELTCDTLKGLWDEVREFWLGRDMTRPTSRFLN